MQEEELAEAYWRLGQALAAELGHPDRQHVASVKACFYPVPLLPVHTPLAHRPGVLMLLCKE